MSLAAGALSQVSVGSNSAQLSSAAATGGVGPITYQWYRSTTNGFSPGVGSLISGATSLSLNDSGLIPNVTYYYVVVATDTGNGNATANSSQLTVVTAATTLNPNAFAQSPVVGQLDLKFNYDTISAMIDTSQATPLYQGMPVKIVDSADGVPKVIGCTANSDEVYGYINFDIKTIAYTAGMPCELSQDGNVMYLYATGAISRGRQVTLDVANGGVAQLVGSSGADVVGFAMDKAAAAGALIRVKLSVPSFAKA